MSEQPVRTSKFKVSRPRFDADRAARQGQVMRLAIDTLGAGPAIAFMNEIHPDLSARPMDLAGESLEGSTTVRALLTNSEATPVPHERTECGASDN